MLPPELVPSDTPTLVSGEPHGKSTILVVGVGSSHGDDQVGWFVAKELMQRSMRNCQVRIAATPLEILNWLEDFTLVHVIDACQGGGRPGTI